jgi:hypothetical protein
MSRFGFLESTIRPLSNASMKQYSSFGKEPEDFLSSFGPGSAYRANKLRSAFGNKMLRFGDDDEVSVISVSDDDEVFEFGKRRKTVTIKKTKTTTIKKTKKVSKKGKSAKQLKNQANASKAMKMASSQGISLKAAWKKVKSS